MQASIEETSISTYVEYAIRLRKRIEYLVSDKLNDSEKKFVINTIWDKSLSPKVCYRPEKDQTVNTSINKEPDKRASREEEISTIKKLIVRNKDNLPVLQAYSDYSRNTRVEDMTPEQREAAIRILETVVKLESEKREAEKHES